MLLIVLEKSNQLSVLKIN